MLDSPTPLLAAAAEGAESAGPDNALLLVALPAVASFVVGDREEGSAAPTIATPASTGNR